MSYSTYGLVTATADMPLVLQIQVYFGSSGYGLLLILWTMGCTDEGHSVLRGDSVFGSQVYRVVPRTCETPLHPRPREEALYSS